jgi:chemotaxis protein methyltransferase CheR
MRECVMSEILSLSNHEFGLIKDLVYDRFGINLGEKKKALVSGRLNKVVKQNGFRTEWIQKF